MTRKYKIGTSHMCRKCGGPVIAFEADAEIERLRRELAETRVLLREALASVVNTYHRPDVRGPNVLRARIDAFLAADQPDPRNPTVKCRPFDLETGEPISSDKSGETM